MTWPVRLTLWFVLAVVAWFAVIGIADLLLQVIR